MAIGLNDIQPQKSNQQVGQQGQKPIRPWQSSTPEPAAEVELDKYEFIDASVGHIIEKNSKLASDIQNDPQLDQYREFLNEASEERSTSDDLDRHLLYRAERSGGVVKFFQRIFS